MGRSPVKTLDRMLTREKLVLSALVAFTVTQQRLHDLVLDEDDGARGSSSDDEYMGQYQRAHAAMLQQCGILCSAIEPQLRPKTRYSIGPERWSFERIERQFGNSASCEAMFRFSLPYLRQLYAALDFPCRRRLAAHSARVRARAWRSCGRRALRCRRKQSRRSTRSSPGCATRRSSAGCARSTSSRRCASTPSTCAPWRRASPTAGPMHRTRGPQPRRTSPNSRGAARGVSCLINI